jgi:chromosome segregation ATPase
MGENLTEKMPGNNHPNELINLVRGIDGRLQSLEKKVDERLYDTRPIWENVQQQLSQLAEVSRQNGELLSRHEDRFNQLEDQLNQLRSDMERGFRQIGGQIDTLAGNYVRLNASLRDLEDRFKNSEPRVS